jgi:hypothetical protein
VVSITSIRCSSGRKALLSASLSIAFAMAASAAFHPSCLNGPFYGRLYRGRGRAASTPSAGFATPSGFAGTPGIAAFDSLNAGRTAASSRLNVSVSLTKSEVPISCLTPKSRESFPSRVGLASVRAARVQRSPVSLRNFARAFPHGLALPVSGQLESSGLLSCPRQAVV